RRHSRFRLLPLRCSGRSRIRTPSLGVFLGVLLLSRGPLRRIHVSRLRPVHPRTRHGLLAFSHTTVARLRRSPLVQQRGNLGRHRRRGPHRPLLVLHPTTHRLPVVRGRHARQLRLQRNFPFFRPR